MLIADRAVNAARWHLDPQLGQLFAEVSAIPCRAASSGCQICALPYPYTPTLHSRSIIGNALRPNTLRQVNKSFQFFAVGEGKSTSSVTAGYHRLKAARCSAVARAPWLQLFNSK